MRCSGRAGRRRFLFASPSLTSALPAAELAVVDMVVFVNVGQSDFAHFFLSGFHGSLGLAVERQERVRKWLSGVERPWLGDERQS